MVSYASDDDSVMKSVLGTREYWIDRYRQELELFESSGDEGEIWFGKSAERRVINYILESNIDFTSRFIELGCGNGSLLRELRRHGFQNLTGIDYCPEAICLAQGIIKSEQHQSSSPLPFISFVVADLLSDCDLGRFDVVLDKGTWDAVSLSLDRMSRLAAYRRFLCQVMDKNALFIILSCNFTSEELQSQFVSDGLYFVTNIEGAKPFVFGGKSGVTSSGAVFRRIT